MSIGDDDDGARNRVTTVISHLAVACGSQPTNAPQFEQDRLAACTLRGRPMTATLLPQRQVRSSRTCWPIKRDGDGGVGSNRSNCIVQLALAMRRRFGYTRPSQAPGCSRDVVKAVGVEPPESVACRAWLREPAALK